jgi:CxxC-x17-CxxC domain-containing protein
MDNVETFNDLLILGRTNFRGEQRAFGIKPDDRRRHVYVVGKTGSGKSWLLGNMIIQDIQAGRGVAVVDPHGDLVDRILNYIPSRRINEVVYFDPADLDYPVGFNVLQVTDQKYKYLIASGLVTVFKKMWADTWGPRLEYILRNTILALLEYPSATLLGVNRLLVDKEFRRKVVQKVTDPTVKQFWVDEFANYNERFRTEAISPIQNKVGQFLSSAIIRNIVGQPKSTIDLAEIMNEGKVFLINLAKGRVGEDNAALLGAMLITQLQIAAMDRVNIPEEQRRDFYLYVDEFQNFATESFAAILSEARKYHLNLTVAHQYISQMEEPVRDAVFGNVGTMVIFRVGAYDAEFIEPEFAPYFTKQDLVNLDKYHAYIRLMIDGIASKPFSMVTFADAGVSFPENRAKVIAVSRERYGRKRAVVEEKIARWLGAGMEVTPPRPERRGEERPVRERRERERKVGERAVPTLKDLPPPTQLADVTKETGEEVITDLSAVLRPKSGEREERAEKTPAFEITCARCGERAEVPFRPDPTRETLCRECLDKVRALRRKKAAAPLPPKPPPIRR